jgi:hypothetical protein
MFTATTIPPQHSALGQRGLVASFASGNVTDALGNVTGGTGPEPSSTEDTH